MMTGAARYTRYTPQRRRAHLQHSDQADEEHHEEQRTEEAGNQGVTCTGKVLTEWLDAEQDRLQEPIQEWSVGTVSMRPRKSSGWNERKRPSVSGSGGT